MNRVPFRFPKSNNIGKRKGEKTEFFMVFFNFFTLFNIHVGNIEYNLIFYTYNGLHDKKDRGVMT